MGRRTRALGFLVTVVFLALVVSRVNVDEVGDAFRHADYRYVVPAVLCTVASYLLRTQRWRIILSPVQRTPWNVAFPVLMIGFMANNVLPVRMGELVRAHVLGRRALLSRSFSLATIVVERVCDGVMLVLILLLVSSRIAVGARGEQVEFVAALVFGAVLLGVVGMLLRQDLVLRVVGAASSVLPHRLQNRVGAMAEAFILGFRAFQHGRAMLGIALLSVAVWCVEATSYYVLMIGFGIGAAPLERVLAAALVMALVNLGSLIPSAPGYVGTFQFFAVAALAPFGVAPGLALSFAVVSHLTQYLLVTTVGLLFMWKENLSLGGISHAEPIGNETSAG